MSTTVADLAATLQSVFTTEADEAGINSGFIRRKRSLTGSLFVQTLTFAWLHDPKAALPDLADLAADLGCPISPQALDQRFTPQAVACLEQTLYSALLRLVEACPVASALLDRFSAVHVRDCSTITLPGSLAELLPGCGHGRPDLPCSGVKLHVGLELRTGALENLSLQAAHISDHCVVGTEAPLPKGAILLEDLGFFDIRRLRHYAEQGCYVLSRAPVRLLVRAEGQRQKNLVKFLQGARGNRLDCWVTVGRRHKTWRCRLIAVRVPEEVAQQRLARAEKEAKDLGRKLSEQKKAMCQWTVLLTNVPGTLLSVEEALALRRVRWQIELLFRVWKDEGKVDEFRGKKPYRVLCEVLAKLLGQVVQHWLLLLGGSPLEVSPIKAARRVRRRAEQLALCLGTLQALVTVLERLQHSLRQRACRKGGRPERPTTLELLRQLAPGAEAEDIPPPRPRCRIPKDIAKSLGAA
jgi:Transposase DDE domain